MSRPVVPVRGRPRCNSCRYPAVAVCPLWEKAVELGQEEMPDKCGFADMLDKYHRIIIEKEQYKQRTKK